MLRVVQRIIDKSRFQFNYVDLGGGMGIDYGIEKKLIDYKKYSQQIEKFKNRKNVKIIFEPGRSIIGDTGYLLTKIIYIKNTSKLNFIIIDAGMNDLMRPALYKAYHKIIPTRKSRKRVLKSMILLDLYVKQQINFYQ